MLTITWFVPGRIEVFGKHTDYAGGRSILAASSQGITVSASKPRGSDALGQGQVLARSTAVPDPVRLAAGTSPGLPAGHWGNYVQATIDRLSSNFGAFDPAVIEVDSTLPLASGMSSSSAFVCAVALALADHADLWSRPEWAENIRDNLDLAAYLATIENGLDYKALPGTKGVGTFGGSQDHTAMLNCQDGRLGLFQFAPAQSLSDAPMPKDHTFVVAVSGVLAEKTGSALADYNNASSQVRNLLRLWNGHAGTSHTALAHALQEDGAAQVLRELASKDPRLSERLTAYLTEMEQAIPAAFAALQAGNLEAFGQAADLSHRSADQHLKNQVSETNSLQETARDLGAVAASGFGAGFGGSVWAMLPTAQAENFSALWLERYLQRFPEHTSDASVIVTPAGTAARRLS